MRYDYQQSSTYFHVLDCNQNFRGAVDRQTDGNKLKNLKEAYSPRFKKITLDAPAVPTSLYTYPNHSVFDHNFKIRLTEKNLKD